MKHDSFRKHAYSPAGELLCSRRRTAQGFLKEHGSLLTSNFSHPTIQWLGIKRPPEELKKRIRSRLIKRLPGIIGEVKKLHRQGLSWKRLFELGLEYRYVSLYLRGKLSHLQLTQQLTSQIWHYAKRQMTWFKKNKEIRWISSNKEALRRAPISSNDGK